MNYNNEIVPTAEAICAWPERLLDPGSFVELGGLIRDSGVITGYGTIDQRLIFVFGQYGPVNLAHAGKVCEVYKSALRMGAPVVGFMDSPGLKLTDGLDGLEGSGRILAAQARAKSVVPQICVVMGHCMGLSALTAAASDFVLTLSGKSSLFLQSPDTYKDGGKAAAPHSDICLDSEESLLAAIRELINYLPSNHLESPGRMGEQSGADLMVNQPQDDPNRTDPALNDIIQATGEYEARDVILSITDNHTYLETKKEYGAPAVTAFGRFNGYTAGIIATRGAMPKDSLKKIHDFLNLCDSFFIPVVTLTDAAGYEGFQSDDPEILGLASELARSFVLAAVPKINIITGRAAGSPYLIMNSRHLGADAVYAWPSSEISVMEKPAASKILKIDIDASPYEAGARGYVDGVIEPSETRKIIIASLEMLSSKRSTSCI